MFRLRKVLFLAPALSVIVAALGCPSKQTPPPSVDGGGKEPTGEKKELKPVAATGRGVLKGKVTLEGNKPDLAKLTSELQEKMKSHPQNGAACMMGDANETSEQEWRIDDNGGVANVFVWLKAPEGTYFELDDKDRVPKKKEETIDQPHCAFLPHALVLFPSFSDPKSKPPLKSTGQSLVVLNSADFTHNTNWSGGPRNPGDNKLIQPKGKVEVPLKPSDKEVIFKCDVHTWMRAYVRVFDHPFATVSREDGSYEIANVPAGADVSIMYWHESMKEPRELKKAKLNAGDNDESIKISAAK